MGRRKAAAPVATPREAAEDEAVAVRYWRGIDEMRGSAKALAIAVCNCGGEAADQFDLLEFWDRLREDMPWGEHARFTTAWLATCTVRGDAAKERATLRRFIITTARALGYLKGG